MTTPDMNQRVAHLATLARLQLTPSELETFSGQIGKILDYVGELQKVDVSQVEPLFHPIDLETPLREVQVIAPPRDEAGKPKVLKVAPDVLYDGFKVPQIL